MGPAAEKVIMSLNCQFGVDEPWNIHNCYISMSSQMPVIMYPERKEKTIILFCFFTTILYFIIVYYELIINDDDVPTHPKRSKTCPRMPMLF